MTKSRDKGNRFEREAVHELEEFANARRVPGSGSIGTNLGLSTLTGDVHLKYPWFSKSFKCECKTGYGTPNQMQFKREWVTKVREEANANNNYPAVLLKFSGVTFGDLGSAKQICFSFDVWNKLMSEVEDLYEDNIKLRTRLLELEKQNAQNQKD